MQATSNWMVHDHRKFDAALEECELCAGAEDWNAVKRLFGEFAADLELHMRLEDEVLYPLFEQKGDPLGLIAELTDEHETIVRLLRDLQSVIQTNDFDHFLESLHPLRRVMSEHNRHEEDAFREMADDDLLTRRAEVMDRLASTQHREGRKVWDI